MPFLISKPGGGRNPRPPRLSFLTWTV